MYKKPSDELGVGFVSEVLKKFFNTGGLSVRAIVIPDLFVKKLNLLYIFLYKNKVSVVALTSWIFNFSIGCFYDLIENGKITSFIHLIKLCKAVKNSLKAYVEISMEQYGFFQNNQLKYLITEMQRRKFNYAEQTAFADFFRDNSKFYLSERIVLSIDDINEMFNKWSEYKRTNKC